MNKVRVALLLILLLAMASGCQPSATPPIAPTEGSANLSPAPPDPTQEVEASSTPSDAEDTALESPLATSTGDGQSGGEDTLLSPLATSTSAAQVPEVPAPSSDEVGVVTGHLLGGDPPLPVEWGILYLGSVTTAEDGSPIMVSTDKAAAPSTVVQAAGQFAFTDVPPGPYALVLDLIASTIILRDPIDGQDLLFEVRGGEITDLGDLIYSDMPTPP